MVQLPNIFRIRQKFEAPRVDDIEAEVAAQLGRLALGDSLAGGKRVAITAGSRGIANIHTAIKATADHIKSVGGEPFIVPAMGSHGGGTSEGQRQVIESYGITEQYCGCPILSSMETVVVCDTDEGFPVHFDRNAFEADYVVVVNRVKPHTNFCGDIESGLMKMMLIGLGKQTGATIYHRAIKDYSFGQIVRSVARQVLEKCRVMAGVALVENGYDETARIEAVAPSEFEAREKELLALAKQWMPRLLLRDVDVLLIDRIGKDISGTGMDTNVIGRKYNETEATDRDMASVRKIIVRGLTPQSHGNACGMGLAEFCKSSLIDEMDQHATWNNCLTAGHVSGARIPMHFATDRQLLETVLPMIGLTEPPHARIQWIRDTLNLGEVECSQAYWDEAQQRSDVEVLTQPRPLPLDAQGNLPDTVNDVTCGA